MLDFAANEGYTRRDFLRVGGLLLGGIALGEILKAQSTSGSKQSFAKSIIYICLDGGPCHIDTFDPKPKAGRDYFGPFKQPLPTNVPGIEINEKLQLLSKMADKYSIIRSMTHGFNGHETAQYVTQTGTVPSGEIYPAFGAVISFNRKSTYNNTLPSFVTITAPSSRFNEAGFLGPEFKPYATGGAPENAKFQADGIGFGNFKIDQVTRRQTLLQSVDSFARVFNKLELFKQMDDYRRKSWELILGDAKNAFDLKKESEETITRYGKNRFGQSCLLARRLVEYGVPVITVRSSGWDTHKQHFERMNEKLPELDKGVSSLLIDLEERNMLKETIIIVGGEFGRTPKILWEPPWNGGRGHFGAAFSYLVAGGGFKGGLVYGSTDIRGETVTDRPVHPAQLIATIYSLLGIDIKGMLPHPYKNEVPILPNPKGILKELMNS